MGYTFKKLYRVSAITVAMALMLSVTAAAIPLKDKYQVIIGDRSEFEEIDTPAYSSLQSEYKEKGYKNAEAEVLPESLKPRLSEGSAVMENNIEGYSGEVFVWDNKADAEWSFNVPKSGLYNIKIDYLLDQDGMYAVRSLLIDGNAYSTETNKVSFFSLYKDDSAGGIMKNSLGDEIRPKQLVIRRWQSMCVSDSFGAYSGELPIYFSAGSHSVTLKYVSSKLYIRNISLVSPAETPDYDEYVSIIGEKPSVKGELTFEAENILEKTHATTRMTGSYDPEVTPKSLTSVKLNTMGGSMWNSAGEGVKWQFEVPESGYYNLGFRVQQNFSQGVPVYRRITVDGALPFEELAAYKFPYSAKWQLITLSDAEKPYKIYLQKGSHTLEMMPTIGEMSVLMNAVNDCSKLLSTFILDVIMITTSDPDLNYDYNLEQEIPQITEYIDKLYDYQLFCLGELEKTAQKKSSLENTFNQLLDIFGILKEDPENTVKKITELQTHLSSLSNIYLSLQSQPLTIDSFSFGEAAEFKKPKGNVFEKLYSVCASLVLSFIKDYDNVKTTENSVEYTDSISVWCGMGTEWAQAQKEVTDEYFVTETGIGVDMNILPSAQLSAGSVNALLLAICSGSAPDVAIGISETSPGEFAMRDAVVDLSKLDGFDDVMGSLVKNSEVIMTYNDGVYGLPMQVNFKLMFYRKDIFRKYGFSLPETWQDVYDTLLPQLYQNNMKMYVPNDIGMFMSQFSANYYNEDYTASAMDSPEAYKAFLTNTQLFTNYGFDVSASFYNRFRSGEMPIGISTFSDYMALQVAAPELTGKWGIALIPGTERADGSIDKSYMGITSSSAVILSGSDKKQPSWDYLKWFMSEDIQYRYCSLIEASIGQDSRVATANKSALLRLSWDADDIDIIEQSISSAKDTPAVLGGYYTTRHLSNAWNRVVLQGKPPRAALEQAVEDINKEIISKRKEYGLQ